MPYLTSMQYKLSISSKLSYNKTDFTKVVLKKGSIATNEKYLSCDH